ncbi:MAG: CaiB/BaiF CoA transferase family protein [Planctomycetota bacterium]|jgi:crotonobetainyl-CoA:carnitine CoA-transferase CaiB-like acyl-CoA transferase
MQKLTVLSLEQALSLSYATQRFVHLGWRVIRIEATPSGGRLPGDPNRYVGKPPQDATDEGKPSDLHSYFIGPNVGKETISLNLKDERGQAVLRRLIDELPADIFASNTLPKRYRSLGIDYETLSAVSPRLIWAGLSAMGPDYPDAPGYDPALQAMTGYMDITGDPEGPPMLCGVPFVDLKAGDEVFANVCLALAERAQTGRGKRIDVSMAQAAVSWLITTIPLLDLGHEPHEITRNANEHREFVPVNVYPTSDGYIYLAIGNDVQWARLTSIEPFAGLASPSRETNEGRKKERESIHKEIASITPGFNTGGLITFLTSKGLVAAPIHTVPQVIDYPPIRDVMLETETPSGERVRLPPPSVEQEHLASVNRRLPYAPSYAQNTDNVFQEAGFSSAEISGLRESGIIA